MIYKINLGGNMGDELGILGEKRYDNEVANFYFSMFFRYSAHPIMTTSIWAVINFRFLSLFQNAIKGDFTKYLDEL